MHIKGFDVPREFLDDQRLFRPFHQRVLLVGECPAGWYTAAWDGRSEGKADAPSGVYFAVIRAGSWHEARKMILLR